MFRQKLKTFLVDYFSFTRRERWAVACLFSIVVVLFVVPDYLPLRQSELQPADSILLRLAGEWERKDSSRGMVATGTAGLAGAGSWKPVREQPAGGQRILFPFDPNTASERDLVRLGISARTAVTILRYRSRGGRFRKPEDLGRIYGFREALLQELLPFIRIQGGDTARRERPEAGFREKGGRAEQGGGWTGRNGAIRGEAGWKEEGRPEPTMLDINTADSASWLSLRGIGPRLAGRIIAFREKLGGFYRVEQVGEVYGLPDSVFQQLKSRLKLGEAAPRQLDINTAPKEELAAHPYIRWQLAQAIVRYREAHGGFRSVDELRQIHLVGEELLNKIAPYCKIH